MGETRVLKLLCGATVLCAATFLAIHVMGAAAAPAPHETVLPQFGSALPNLPGKRMTVVEVDYPPGAMSLSHRHAPSAFLFAYVLSGAVRSQQNGGPVMTFHAGEHWVELPGTHHQISENASATEPARLLVVFVVKGGETLTIPDSDDQAANSKPKDLP